MWAEARSRLRAGEQPSDDGALVEGPAKLRDGYQGRHRQGPFTRAGRRPPLATSLPPPPRRRRAGGDATHHNSAANFVRLALGLCSTTPGPTGSTPSAGLPPPSPPRLRVGLPPSLLPSQGATPLHLPPWPPRGVDGRRRPHQGPPEMPVRWVGRGAQPLSDAGVVRPSCSRPVESAPSLVVGRRAQVTRSIPKHPT